MNAFELTIDARESDANVVVQGEVDLTTAPQLDENVRRLFAQGARSVSLDFSAVSFMDSTGLRALLTCERLAREAGGQMFLAELSEPVRRLIEISGLENHFTRA